MRYVVQRLGFRISRGWAIMLLAVLGLLGTAFWIGPFRPLPADLRLVALGGDGQFRPVIGFPASWADSTPPQPDSKVRFPLVLAVYNEGARAATPRRVALSIPAAYRLSNAQGIAYEGKVTHGNPLVRYVFDVRPGRIEPRQLPRLLAGLDTLWLEPVVPSYYCTTQGDSIPEFQVAPKQDASALARVQIYYSFDARVRDRQSGLLTIQMPAQLLEHEPPSAPPVFPVTIYKPRVIRPPMRGVRLVGTRTTYCGDAGNATALRSTLWETRERGRVFLLDYGGAPRKYAFDLNRDSIIELEQWDADGDGVFEAQRPAQFAIPEFLIPPRPVKLARADSVPADSLRADSLRADSLRLAGTAVDSAVTTVADTAFKFPSSVFHDTDAGVFRYWRAQQRARGVDVPEPARPRRETGPRLLGRPLPNFPAPRRDTIPTTTTGN